MIEGPTSPSVRGRLRTAVWSLAIAVVLVAGPTVGETLAADPTPTADPSATASPTASVVPTPTPLTVVSLLRRGDFVRQYTSRQCVGASLQIMRNIIKIGTTRSRVVQRILWLRARRTSLYKADGGADPFGWTAATAMSGHGRYVLVAADSLQGILHVAARGMALTHRPAGIVVWRGAHAWVLTGVDTTADPATTDDFRVVAGRIADPLYPYYRVWHRTIYRPGTRLSLSVLARNYSPYHDGRRDPRIEGKWVAIVPLRDTDPLPAGAVGAPAATPSPPNPTMSPSPVTSAAPAPTDTPSTEPSTEPSPEPSAAPSPQPTPAPTAAPAASPDPTVSAEPSPSG